MYGSGVPTGTGIIRQGALRILRGGLRLVLAGFCGAGPGTTSGGTAVLRTASVTSPLTTGTNLRYGSISSASVLLFLSAKGFFVFTVRRNGNKRFF